MKLYKFLVTLITSMIVLCCATGAALPMCKIIDEEAIEAAISFCRKIGVKFSGKPWIMMTHELSRQENSSAKDVAFGERGNTNGIIMVNCNDRNIIYYDNLELIRNIKKKYGISPKPSGLSNWPPFLTEDKARERMLIIAKSIGIPKDMVLDKMRLSEKGGKWLGYWSRKLNGFYYEDNKITTTIMAVDGELVFYRNRYYGKPCPTEVKVSKEEAIKEGWRHAERLLSLQKSNRSMESYNIKSELKIVQPNVSVDGGIVHRRSPESRLAWVINYSLKQRTGDDDLVHITMKIDAATKKFLGGEHTR